MRSHRIQTAKRPSPSRKKRGWLNTLAGLAAIAMVLLAGGRMQQAQIRNSPEIIRAPDRNQVNDINRQQVEKQNFEAANAARKKQINEDSARLLKLATDLKAELDKTDQDTLSVDVIRRADQIQKLAHDIKEKMKVIVGTS